MTNAASITRRMFASLVRRREDRIDLGMAALLIAQEESPALVIEDYVERLNYLGAEFHIDLPVDADAETACRTLRRVLVDVHTFRGNREDYYNPANSYLDQVLDRRLGIPISLSIVYMEVARRAGVTLLPVSFPGHFLLRHADDTSFYLDPFNSGRILTLDNCRDLLRSMYPGAEFSESMLGAATKRQVITRLLLNLKGIYTRNEDAERALRIVELLTAVTPWDLDQLRDRGILYYRTGQTDRAIADLQAFADHAAPGPEVDSVREALRRLSPP